MGQICSTTPEIDETPQGGHTVENRQTQDNGAHQHSSHEKSHHKERKHHSSKHRTDHHTHSVTSSRHGHESRSRDGSERHAPIVGDLTEDNLKTHTKNHAYNKRKSIVDILTDAESDHSVNSQRSSSRNTINYSEAGLQPYNPGGIAVINDNGEVNGMILPSAEGGSAGGGQQQVRSQSANRHRRQGSSSRSHSTRSPRRIRRTSRTPPVATLHETTEEHRQSSSANQNQRTRQNSAAAHHTREVSAGASHGGAHNENDPNEVSHKRSRSSRHNSTGLV